MGMITMRILYNFKKTMKRKREMELQEKMRVTNQDLLQKNGGIRRNIIYCDPPWSYRGGETIKGKPPYPTLSLEELKLLKVPEIAADDSILFLWVTSPMLPNCLE